MTAWKKEQFSNVSHDFWIAVVKIYLVINLSAWVVISTYYIIRINRLAAYSRRYGDFTIILGGSLLILIDYKDPRCPDYIRNVYINLLGYYFIFTGLCFLPLVAFRVFVWPYFR